MDISIGNDADMLTRRNWKKHRYGYVVDTTTKKYYFYM